jgi:hypothetical protein
MPHPSSLEDAPLNFTALREAARDLLLAALDSVAGSKILVLDRKIIGPLGIIAPVALLKVRARP